MEFLPDSLFIKSRFKLKELLMPSSVVIVSSNRLMPRNADQHFPYRQSSDMYYLTGITQEHCTLVIYPKEEPGMYEEILYIPEGDDKSAMWDGPKITTLSAAKTSGISEVRNTKELQKDVREFLSNCSYVYFGTHSDNSESIFPSNEMEIMKDASSSLMHIEEHHLAPLMTRLRMHKEPEEIEMMKRAITITDEAFIRVLQEVSPGMKEYEIAALLTYEFQTRGAREHAFDPIVASGKNGLVLHYIENLSTCKDGDLLLMDFGADWEYYAADISRTIPINGRFSKRQRELYDANLRVIQKAMKLMKPGILLKDFNSEVGLLWEEEHVKLGLYTMSDINKQSKRWPMWQKYYWHGTSHSIGIDVHDCFDQMMPLQPGMVLSCEPGIYIPEEGIGIRLENDILITSDEPINLSDNIPIDPDAIEMIMNNA